MRRIAMPEDFLDAASRPSGVDPVFKDPHLLALAAAAGLHVPACQGRCVGFEISTLRLVFVLACGFGCGLGLAGSGLGLVHSCPVRAGCCAGRVGGSSCPWVAPGVFPPGPGGLGVGRMG